MIAAIHLLPLVMVLLLNEYAFMTVQFGVDAAVLIDSMTTLHSLATTIMPTGIMVCPSVESGIKAMEMAAAALGKFRYRVREFRRESTNLISPQKLITAPSSWNDPQYIPLAMSLIGRLGLLCSAISNWISEWEITSPCKCIIC